MNKKMGVGVVNAKCVRCLEEMRVPVNRTMTVAQLLKFMGAYICPMCRKLVSDDDLLRMDLAGLR